MCVYVGVYMFENAYIRTACVWNYMYMHCNELFRGRIYLHFLYVLNMRLHLDVRMKKCSHTYHTFKYNCPKTESPITIFSSNRWPHVGPCWRKLVQAGPKLAQVLMRHQELALVRSQYPHASQLIVRKGGSRTIVRKHGSWTIVRKHGSRTIVRKLNFLLQVSSRKALECFLE